MAAIAYPSYLEQVRETRRANAQADMQELASYLERFYGENFTYQGAGGGNQPFGQSPKTGQAYYNLNLNNLSATGFDVQAVPQGSQADDSCGTMVLDETGAGTPAGCWN
ncbi:pilus assembly protein PilE [Methylophaga sp. OBS1]|nr:pilus assembly protein PilE [Methylophaga sp. OBS1]